MIEEKKLCGICGEPMPKGEEVFKYHGYSGPCPKPPLAKQQPSELQQERDSKEAVREYALDAFKTIRSCVEAYLSEGTAHGLQNGLDRVEEFLRTPNREVQRPDDLPSHSEIRAAIKETECKYFGDYEFSESQSRAVQTLVKVAENMLSSPERKSSAQQPPVSNGDEVEGVAKALMTEAVHLASKPVITYAEWGILAKTALSAMSDDTALIRQLVKRWQNIYDHLEYDFTNLSLIREYAK